MMNEGKDSFIKSILSNQEKNWVKFCNTYKDTIIQLNSDIKEIDQLYTKWWSENPYELKATQVA